MDKEKRLIDANALLDYLRNEMHESEVIEAVKDAPTVDAVEVVHGMWQERRFICMDSEVMLGYRCSKCKLTFDVGTNYCPNCGAKMDGGNEDV